MKTPEEMFWEIYAIFQTYAAQFQAIKPIQQLPTPDRIIQYVADSCLLTVEQLTSKTRKREIAEPRQLLSALLRFGLRLSSADVGKLVGNFDHATVLHSIKEVSIRYAVYPAYRKTVDKMIDELFATEEIRQHIKDRIADPHLDRKQSMFKLVTA